MRRGKYVTRDASIALPFLRAPDMQRFLDRLENEEETDVLADWRDWIRPKYPKKP